MSKRGGGGARESRAAMNNRSNQLNPNNSAFKTSRGLSVPSTAQPPPENKEPAKSDAPRTDETR